VKVILGEWCQGQSLLWPSDWMPDEKREVAIVRRRDDEPRGSVLGPAK